jgi:hypothetical protein
VVSFEIQSAAPSQEDVESSPRASQPLESRACARPITSADKFAQTMVLAVLFAVPALMCVHMATVTDSDVWWHLRTGEWILQHHAVPHVDSFSTLAGKPWVAYSWLFECIVARLFQWLGLVGIVSYSTGMVLAVTLAMYHLLRRLQGDFTLSVMLTFVAMYSMGPLFTPRPWLFTILFFALELNILMQSRKTGKLRELAWLPVIFALWANTHIQFIDGLLVLGLAVAEAVLGRWSPAARTNSRPVWLGATLVASAFATLVNPYGWRVYTVAYDLATQTGALNKISELQAIPFRSFGDFLILLLALSGMAALAWRRRLLSFESALLVFAVVLSFRSQRDVWLVATVSAAILAATIASNRKLAGSLPVFATRLAISVAVVAVVAGFHLLHVTNDRLQNQMAETLPVRAVAAIRKSGYSGPLYNDFNWGGYLIWELRMPVSLDGRQNLYGDPWMDRSVATWNAEPDWASDPELISAGLVIGPLKAPLTQVLRRSPKFQIAYEDQLAAVFVARKTP